MLRRIKREYRYFVSYSHNTNSFGNGMTEIHLEKPVKTIDDVRLFKQSLEEEGMENVVILNYQLL